MRMIMRRGERWRRMMRLWVIRECGSIDATHLGFFLSLLLYVLLTFMQLWEEMTEWLYFSFFVCVWHR